MRIEKAEYLVVYAGQNTATYLYQKLLKKQCKVELVSTPSKIYHGCSHSIKFDEDDLNVVIDETRKMNIPPKGIYKIIRDGNYENYEKL